MSICARDRAHHTRAISVPEMIAALQSHFIMWILHCSIGFPRSHRTELQFSLISQEKVHTP
jgi:hypothetical protein